MIWKYKKLDSYDYPYHFIMDRYDTSGQARSAAITLAREAFFWCQTTLKENVWHHSVVVGEDIFSFRNEGEAALFKLTWVTCK